MDNKVTALIVTYRRPEFLRRAILSVLGQTYSNLQLKIFDDASDDATRNIRSKRNLIVLRNKNNLGYEETIKKGFNFVSFP